MTEAFTNKIRQIILSNIERESFGVRELANELGISRSQLLRKTKASTGKSVNLLIREIRLIEAARLIQNGELTASEIAYRVGFSSPSYFNKCFHEHFGYTPGEFKKLNEDGSLDDGTPGELKSQRAIKGFRLLLFSIVFIAVIIVVYLVLYHSVFQNRTSQYQHASIAVLPFLDLSENKDQEHVADGITEAITMELSKRDAIRVISRTSAMRYKGEKKLSMDIAKELGVDLLLEGSILHSSDSLRVVVQLIEPFPRENHIWADSYDQKFVDVLQLVRKISNEIAREVNLLVKPGEPAIGERPVDQEAYDLYLRARHLWNQQNTRSVKSAVEYLKESIRIDSGYAPAYATLAEAYISLNKLIRDNEEKLRHRENSRIAIKKALELDPSSGAAHITKANIIGKFGWDWEEMKEMVERGLKLEPNNPYGYLLLSNYYLVKGEIDMAIKEALIAEKLDPINPMTGCLLAERYFLAKEYEKSFAKYNQVLELYPNYGFAWDGIGYVQFITGDTKEALNSWRELHVIMGNTSMAEIFVKESFDESIHYWSTNCRGLSLRHYSDQFLEYKRP